MLNKLKTVYYTLLYVTLFACVGIIYAEYNGTLNFQGVGYKEPIDYVTIVEADTTPIKTKITNKNTK